MEHKGTKYLETERLILRPFAIEDAEAMYSNYASDDEVTKFLSWPTHSDVSVSESVLREWTARYGDSSYYNWAIVLKEYSAGPIGGISVVRPIDDLIKNTHVGYCIGRRWWHSGITSEALKRIMDFLFDEVGVNKVEAMHDPRNPHSGMVMRKCGMKPEGIIRQCARNQQGVHDAAYYGLLALERSH